MIPFPTRNDPVKYSSLNRNHPVYSGKPSFRYEYQPLVKMSERFG